MRSLLWNIPAQCMMQCAAEMSYCLEECEGDPWYEDRNLDLEEVKHSEEEEAMCD